jgi:hypothetical protein
MAPLTQSRLRAAGDRAERDPIQQAGKEPPKMSVVDELNRRIKVCQPGGHRSSHF